MSFVWDQRTPPFSFKYGGNNSADLFGKAKIIEPVISGTRTEYGWVIEDCLKITAAVTEYSGFGAMHWVIWFENISGRDTLLLEDIKDCDITFGGYNREYVPSNPGYIRNWNCAKVVYTKGSDYAKDDFAQKADTLSPGEERHYSCAGGRSSSGLAPYFNVNEGDRGALLAIGWSGQWEAFFRADDDGGIRVKTGIEELGFVLRPGEKIRTSAVLLMEYENGQDEAYVAFRRLMKAHYSLIGKPGRPEQGPFCVSAWGAMPSAKMVDRIEKIKEHKLPVDVFWVDAGWYGHSDRDCPNEFTGDWGGHTGSWNINPHCHPDGFRDVAAAAKNAGLGFLLWFEPERVIKYTDSPTEHPDWYLKPPDPEATTWLLDLGNDEAVQGTFEMIDEKINDLGLYCYRQDFNIDPLGFWRANDENDRKGIHEIKHIMGLYKLWDMMLEAHPNLLIDNCASGGKRLDFELMSRSIPLWRSDFQCFADALPEGAQCHTSGISRWLPFTGTGTGVPIGDTYRNRSSYAPALTVEFWMYEYTEMTADQPIDSTREFIEEYKRVRPYLSCDFYPLTENDVSDAVWCAWQFNRPEEGDGVILAFRRPLCNLKTAEFKLNGLCESRVYSFIDEDTGEKTEALGSDLSKGYEVTINNPRQSKLIFYKTK